MSLRTIAQRLRRNLNEMRGAEIPLPVDFTIDRLHLGSEYGGWVIAPSMLPPNPIVFSIGLGTDITFDLAIIEKFNARVFGFDPTPKSEKFIRAQTLPKNFTFVPIGLADFDGEMTFQLGNANYDSYSTDTRYANPADTVTCSVARLTSLMNRVGVDHIDILKMDIEGGEYAVMRDVLSSKTSIRQLLVELHYDKSSDQLTRAKDLVEMIREAGFKLFDRSPVGKELSFIRQD